MIGRGLTHELSGEAKISVEPACVHAMMTIPLDPEIAVGVANKDAD